MSAIFDHVTITLPRRLLEHPRAFHVRRMRAAVWLYLELLARLPQGSDTVAFDPVEIGRTMGLPEGTIVSWLGHLRKYRYVEASRRDGTIRVRVKQQSAAARAETPASPRFFTLAKIEQAIGETGHRDLLESALASHADPDIKRALAGALAVPASEIRRSRTALFLYLLRRNAHEEPSNDPRTRSGLA